MTEENFALVDLTDQAPASICPACAQAGLEHRPTQSQYVHCSHTSVGCMRTKFTDWISAESISGKDFAQSIMLAVLEGEQLATDAVVGNSPYERKLVYSYQSFKNSPKEIFKTGNV